MNIEITCPAARRDKALDVMPQAIKAVGSTTEAAPYRTDDANDTDCVNTHVNAATARPTSNCTPTRRQTDSTG
ncbi:MAG: hypothetical protein A3G82_26705 [Burkholderiales bacterium RIFCSPLOWO2_12_FULL_67_210]|nr:MAG: hypothetical protein A3G82_26705 [Burkholderiales bacterium RIFCSPLOWO2_12_FULL_67_210]